MPSPKVSSRPVLLPPQSLDQSSITLTPIHSSGLGPQRLAPMLASSSLFPLSRPRVQRTAPRLPAGWSPSSMPLNHSSPLRHLTSQWAGSQAGSPLLLPLNPLVSLWSSVQRLWPCERRSGPFAPYTRPPPHPPPPHAPPPLWCPLTPPPPLLPLLCLWFRSTPPTLIICGCSLY